MKNYSIDGVKLLGQENMSLFKKELEDALYILNSETDFTKVFEYFCMMADQRVKQSFEDKDGLDLYYVIGLCLIHKIKTIFHKQTEKCRSKMYETYSCYYHSKNPCGFLEHKLYNLLQFYVNVPVLPTYEEYCLLLFESCNALLSKKEKDEDDYVEYFYIDDMLWVSFHTLHSFRDRIRHASLDDIVSKYVASSYHLYNYTDFLLLDFVYVTIVKRLFALESREFLDHFEKNKDLYHHVYQVNPSSIFKKLYLVCQVRYYIVLSTSEFSGYAPGTDCLENQSLIRKSLIKCYVLLFKASKANFSGSGFLSDLRQLTAQDLKYIFSHVLQQMSLYNKMTL